MCRVLATWTHLPSTGHLRSTRRERGTRENGQVQNDLVVDLRWPLKGKFCIWLMSQLHSEVQCPDPSHLNRWARGNFLIKRPIKRFFRIIHLKFSQLKLSGSHQSWIQRILQWTAVQLLSCAGEIKIKKFFGKKKGKTGGGWDGKWVAVGWLWGVGGRF